MLVLVALLALAASACASERGRHGETLSAEERAELLSPDFIALDPGGIDPLLPSDGRPS